MSVRKMLAIKGMGVNSYILMEKEEWETKLQRKEKEILDGIVRKDKISYWNYERNKNLTVGGTKVNNARRRLVGEEWLMITESRQRGTSNIEHEKKEGQGERRAGGCKKQTWQAVSR